MKDPAVGRQKDREQIASILARLLYIVSVHGLEEAEIRRGNFRCCVRRPPGAPLRGEAVAPPEPPRQGGPVSSQVAEELVDVTAPMTGVFYRAPAPGAPPYVEVGDRVEKGQTLCLVEAMKVFNEIPSPVSGEVVEILAQNEMLVKQGETLMRIKPSSAEEDEGR